MLALERHLLCHQVLHLFPFDLHLSPFDVYMLYTYSVPWSNVSGSPLFLPVALKDLSRRVTTVAAVETIESVDRVRWTSSTVVTVEEVLQKQEERPPRRSIPEQAVPTREPDDWFVLLDVVPREVTYIAPGTATVYPSS